ncbi:MAG: BolA family protein [Thermodesulfobacteriota bacterium]
MNPENIKEMIENGLATFYVKVDGDGSHFEAIVVSDEFKDKMLIERHKLVYGALGDAMKEKIHALSMKTLTVEQWENINK